MRLSQALYREKRDYIKSALGLSRVAYFKMLEWLYEDGISIINMATDNEDKVDKLTECFRYVYDYKHGTHIVVKDTEEFYDKSGVIDSGCIADFKANVVLDMTLNNNPVCVMLVPRESPVKIGKSECSWNMYFYINDDVIPLVFECGKALTEVYAYACGKKCKCKNCTKVNGDDGMLYVKRVVCNNTTSRNHSLLAMQICMNVLSIYSLSVPIVEINLADGMRRLRKLKGVICKVYADTERAYRMDTYVKIITHGTYLPTIHGRD